MSHPTVFSGQVVDLETGTVLPAAVHVAHGRIAAIEPTAEVPPTFLIPGFVDAHVHIESSMLPPAEFGRLATAHGTVAVVADPHEIANVLGEEGVRFMLDEGERTPLKCFFGVPSCVPATIFETAGATLGVEEVERLLDDPRVLHLAEVMNWPGVLARDPELMAKIDAAKRRGKHVDGHAPGVRGDDAKRYAAAGIETDHESFSLEEGLDKIAAGMKVAIREGSAARNLEALRPLLDSHPNEVFLCTDDCHPDGLVAGHIDAVARRAIAAGHDPLAVLRAASLNPIRHYGLPVGLLRVGDPADFLEVDGLESLRVLRTVIDGEVVAEGGVSRAAFRPTATPNRFDAVAPSAEAYRVHAAGSVVRAIRAHDGQLVTDEEAVAARIVDGFAEADPDNDLLLIAVANRYATAPPAVAFVRGIGLRAGAIASSVAHDSHNVVAVGVDSESIATAVAAVFAARGGLAVVDDHGVGVLPLPIAGLMSPASGLQVAAEYGELDRRARALGSTLGAPFMTLSFLALLVIPALKLSDLGLFDGRRFQFVDLFPSD